MSCTFCKKSKKECIRESINDTSAICSKCKSCKKCARINDFCNKCSIKCKKCDKVLIKNNWPEDKIYNGKCGKCFRECFKCKRSVMDHKCIYKHTKRYCEKCFELSNLSCDDKIYEKITTPGKYGKKFCGWKLKKKKISCDSCDKLYWVRASVNNLKCKKCNNIRRDKTQEDNAIEPDNFKSIVACIKCNSIINQRSLIKCKHCEFCNPTTKNKKFKFVKDKHKWQCYSELKKCKCCNIAKWNDPKYENCKKCRHSKL